MEVGGREPTGTGPERALLTGKGQGKKGLKIGSAGIRQKKITSF